LKYTDKHQWSISHNLLSGVTLKQWLKVLRENRYSIDFKYIHRVLFLSVIAINNSLTGLVEKWVFGARVNKVQMNESPLFILGHWRSGTTHLHNLISQDNEQFAYPNTYQVVNPFTFLVTESFFSKCFSWLLPSTRPMDNMEMKFESPQEDEIALCLMSLKSPYLGVSFPRNAKKYQKFLDLQKVSDEELVSWKSSLKQFIKKVTYRVGESRSLVIKSPTHTARIRHLLEVFPKARFVHIHRDPYSVFRSTQHYFDTAAWYIYLQKPDLERLDDQIIERYKDLYSAYAQDVDLIPEGQFYELSYEDLVTNPIEELEGMYGGLQLNDFDQAKVKFKNYLSHQKSYQKNKFNDLPEGVKERIAEQWSDSFERWGYEK